MKLSAIKITNLAVKKSSFWDLYFRFSAFFRFRLFFSDLAVPRLFSVFRLFYGLPCSPIWAFMHIFEIFSYRVYRKIGHLGGFFSQKRNAQWAFGHLGIIHEISTFFEKCPKCGSPLQGHSIPIMDPTILNKTWMLTGL